MTSLSSLKTPIRPRCHPWLALVLLLGLIVPTIQALPPDAPTEGTYNLSFYGSKNDNPYAGLSNLDGIGLHTWRLTWKDNSHDENGYVVRVRYGNVGPFFVYAQLPANSTSCLFSRENPDQSRINLLVQFQVEAWKNNGTNLEASTLTFPTPAFMLPIIPASSVPRIFSPPSIRIGKEATASVGHRLTSASIRVTPNTTTYSVAPEIKITGGNGLARATATLTEGRLTAVTLTNPGGGFNQASPPSVTLIGGTIAVADLAPSISFVDGTLEIDSVTITNAEVNGLYESPPLVQLTATGSGASLKANLTSGRVSSVTVDGAGSNYSLGTMANFTPTLNPRMAPAPDSTVQQPIADDGRITLQWADVSNSELGHLVEYREIKANMSEVDWIALDANISPLNATSATFSNDTGRYKSLATHQYFIPGKSYQFSVRALRGGNESTPRLLSSAEAGAFVMPPLRAPSQLASAAPAEGALTLSWKDNSNNETGFVIENAVTDANGTNYVTVGSTQANTTSLNISVPPGGQFDLRVRSKFEYLDSNNTRQTIFSPTASESIRFTGQAFRAPTNLTATASAGRHGSVLLKWTDNSEVEEGYDVLAKPSGSNEAYKFCRALRANITEVEVDSHATSLGSDGRPNAPGLTPFTPDQAYDFVVRAVTNSESVVSTDSNVATATPKPGMNMKRLYAQGQQGQPFFYQVSTGTPQRRTFWSIAGLPEGLSFSPNTGLISGNPEVSGVFTPTVSAQFSTPPSGSSTASVSLTLRILPRSEPPRLTKALPLQYTLSKGQSLLIDLAQHLSDSDTELAARLSTTLGDLDLKLYPQLTPQSVANFTEYVRLGLYNNVAFHRSIENFVIQAGSYQTPADGSSSFFSGGRLTSPTNEPGLSNLRGTISAAKIGGRDSSYRDANNQPTGRGEDHGYVGLPNSATSDFFLNLADNSDNLDNQNSGFSVYGQLTQAALRVMDQIAARPTGQYNITLNGGSSQVSNFPLDVQSNPSQMNNSLAIRITKASLISPIRLQVEGGNSAVCLATLKEGGLELQGVSVGTTNLSLHARDLDGNAAPGSPYELSITISESFRPPTITRQPSPLTLTPDQNGELSVEAGGSGTLTYQWFRNGSVLEGKTAAKLPLPANAQERAGNYQVVVGSQGSGQSVTSDQVQVSIATAPTFTTPIPASFPPVMVVELGKPFSLELSASAAPAPTYQWQRNGRTIIGQTNSKFSVGAASLNDAGAYRVTALNSGGRTTSARSCEVVVVDKTQRRLVIAPGRTLTLRANLGGNITQYAWRKKVGDAEDTSAGFGRDTLNLPSADPINTPGNYFCRIDAPGDPATKIETGVFEVFVTSQKPQLITPSFPEGRIGDGYQYTLPFTLNNNNAPTQFSARNLPPGLSLNTSTGLISGRPTQAGRFQVRVSASNVNGIGAEVSAALVIKTPEAAASGTYVALINPHPRVNSNKGGRLDITLTDNGSASLILRLGPNTLRLSASLVIRLNLAQNALTYALSSSFKIGRDTGVLYTELNLNSGALSGLVLLDNQQANFSGHRMPWRYRDFIANQKPCFFATGSNQQYNLALRNNPVDSPANPLPRGDGHLAIRISSSGMATYSGRLADGSMLTGSSPVGPLAEIAVFQMLYGQGGSFLARLQSLLARTGNTLESARNPSILGIQGPARWTRDAAATPQNLYPAGFKDLDLTAAGGLYPPRENVTNNLMNLPAGIGNAILTTTAENLDGAAHSGSLTITGTIAKAASANPPQLKMSINAETGAFMGSMLVSRTGQGISASPRSVTFQGLIIPPLAAVPGLPESAALGLSSQTAQEPIDTQGVGYWLGSNLVDQRIVSGKITFGPKPLIITQQPQSQSINPTPGSSLTLTVAASGGYDSSAPITYQWRKNGEDIKNATNALLSIPNVGNGDAGDYTCLVTRGYLKDGTKVNNLCSLLSDKATITVNQPVSNIQIVQEPPQSILPTGSAVELTAKALGTGPFTYQWKRNDVDIANANSATYSIANLGDDQAGSYTVLVRNVLSSNGELSAAKSLSHKAGIQNVQISRLPAEATVIASTPVTYTASTQGFSPRYQWLRNGTAIPGATSATYSFSMSAADQGFYEVAVTNDAIRNAVRSAPDLIHLTPGITEALTTRTDGGLGNTAVAGSTVTLLASVLPDPGTYSYQWLRNGDPIANATSSTLSFQATLPAQGQADPVYRCRVSGGTLPVGGIETSPFTLKVTEAAGPLRIVANATEFRRDDRITLEARTSKTVRTYAWFRGEDQLSGNTNTLTIDAPGPGNQGNYKVKIALAGEETYSEEASFLLSAVTTGAGINNKNTNAAIGTKLYFAVEHDGTPRFDYDWRWYLEGTNASGALHGSTTATQEIITNSMIPGNYRLEVGVRNLFNEEEVVFSTNFTLTSEPQ